MNSDDHSADSQAARADASAPEASKPSSSDLPEVLAAWQSALRADSLSSEFDVPRTGPSRAPQALGRFELRRELGRGGFGVVHLAYDPLLGREVALKVPHAHVLDNPDLRARFEREARATAGLDHPNIVPVYEAGQCDSTAYIALAYCPGLTLHDWLRRRIDSVPGPMIAEFMATLAAAVHHAHRQGVVHRDLKPANVMLVGGEAENSLGTTPLSALTSYQPKITDFGMAKHLDDGAGQTHSRTIAGTPCYMAPEQTGLHTSKIGPATDVYALGSVLYELLTGRAPFQGETVFDTLAQVRGQDPLPPHRLRPGVPRDLEIICLKCLEKDPLRRYATAAALEDDLRRYLGGRSILARPIGPLSQVAKWARRRPTMAALVALASLTALTLVASDIYVRRKNRETQQALQGEIEARDRLSSSLERERQTLYVHRIQLAHAALQDNNVRQAERYLQECLPESGKSDLRQWEWYYLTSQCHTEVLNFRGHDDSARDAVFNHDASRVASVSADGVGLVWDPFTGEIAWRFSTPMRRDSRQRCIDFSACGRFLAYCDAGATYSIQCHAETGAELRRVKGGDPTFSRDGELLITNDPTENLVRIFSAVTGIEREGFSRPGKMLTTFTYCPDGLWMAELGQDQKIQVWDAESDDTRTLTGVPHVSMVLRISPTAKHVASGGRDGSITVWSIDGGEPLFTFAAHQSDVRSIEFSDDGQQFVTADVLGTVKIWNLQGRLVRTVPGHGYIVSKVRFSRDGRYLVSSGADRTVKVWDTQRTSDARILPGHKSFSTGLAFSPDGTQLATCGFDQAVRIWQAATGKLLRNLATGRHPIRLVAYRDNDTLIGSDAMGRIEMWNAQTGSRLKTIPGNEAANLQALAISLRGQFGAKLGKSLESVAVKNLETGQPQSMITLESKATCVTFSSDGARIAIASSDGTLSICETISGKPIRSMTTGNVNCASFSRDGQYLATSGQGNDLIRLWDSHTGQELRSFRTPWGRNNVFTITFSPDGRRLVTGGFDNAVTLWDTATGQEVLGLPSPRFGVTGAVFSDDGRRLAVIVNDGTVAVWDAERS